MEFIISWNTIYWSGLVLFILSLLALFFGDLPDNEGNPFMNSLRWIVWPLFFIWCVAIMIKGLVS